MSAAPLSPELRERGALRAWTSVTLRFNDGDPIGHVNNAVFATMLESGRVALLYDENGCIAGPGYGFALVRLVIDFVAEMHYPGTVDIGTRVERIGRSSLTLGQGIFKDGTCAATAETVIVMLDMAARRSVALTGPVIARLAPLARRADAG